MSREEKNSSALAGTGSGVQTGRRTGRTCETCRRTPEPPAERQQPEQRLRSCASLRSSPLHLPLPLHTPPLSLSPPHHPAATSTSLPSLHPSLSLPLHAHVAFHSSSSSTCSVPPTFFAPAHDVSSRLPSVSGSHLRRETQSRLRTTGSTKTWLHDACGGGGGNPWFKGRFGSFSCCGG